MDTGRNNPHAKTYAVKVDGEMPRTNVFLFVEPEKHYLNYSSCVIREIISANRRPNQTIVELKGEDANPETINREIERTDPIFFWATGHGSPTKYTCECTQTYLEVGNPNIRKMVGRIIQLNSCNTAKTLGPHLIENGVLAYFGSREPFWFYIGSPPCSDRASKAVFLCEHEIARSLMRGYPTRTAWENSQKRYDEEIEYWLTGPGKNHPHAEVLVRLLTINKHISTMLGSQTATITTPSPLLVRIPSPTMLSITATATILGIVLSTGW